MTSVRDLRLKRIFVCVVSTEKFEQSLNQFSDIELKETLDSCYKDWYQFIMYADDTNILLEGQTIKKVTEKANIVMKKLTHFYFKRKYTE